MEKRKFNMTKVLKTKDPELIDLVHLMMQYSPKKRITSY
jgi:hypothetical protein